MTSWLDLSMLPSSAFPAEVFGYPAESTEDDEIIYHVVIRTLADGKQVPPLPKRRMRMKILLADGRVLVGDERE